MQVEKVVSNLRLNDALIGPTREQTETIVSQSTMIASFILTLFQVILPILFIIITAIVIVYDVKSKASTTKKTIISIIGIGFVPVMWIIITILRVALAIA